MTGTGSAAPRWVEFNPHRSLQRLAAQNPQLWQGQQTRLAGLEVNELRADNSRWFHAQTGMDHTLAMVWLINAEFTRRTIAPAWRGIPAFVDVRLPPPKGSQRSDAPRALGDSLRRSLLRRWVDLAWLRQTLGRRHQIHPSAALTWRPAFSGDDDDAIKAFARINAVHSTGGGKYGALTPWQTVAKLALPKLHRIGLVGLADRDAGELRVNAVKRVERLYRPRHAPLMTRDTYAINPAAVERRLLICLAIDLANGSPADASMLFQWITGEPITRQSMQVARSSIARECKLKGKAWQPRTSPTTAPNLLLGGG